MKAYNFSTAQIAGQKITPEKIITITAPADGRIIGSVPALSPQNIQDAGAYAFLHKKQWASRSDEARSIILEKAASLIEQHQDELTELLVHEIAKNRSQARSEVLRTAEYIRLTSKLWLEQVRHPLIMTDHQMKRTGHFTRRPLGVITAISPFNYPINLAVTKIAPALITGNVVLFKPSTNGALAGCRLVELFHEAGVPDYALQALTGRGSEIGDVITGLKESSLINFTGGTAVGLSLPKKAGAPRFIMELGGKDPAIVLADADISATAKEIVKGAFSYSGQRCTAIKRVIASRTIIDQLQPLLIEGIKKLTVGMPDTDADITPLIDAKAADYVMELYRDAISKGAIPLIPCERRSPTLLSPGLLDQVTAEMRIYHEEQFGPLLPLIEAATEDEALAIANELEYGLQASVFTKDPANAARLALLIEAGTVNHNYASSRAPDIFPYPGVKQSGVIPQGATEALLSVTELRGFVTKASE